MENPSSNVTTCCVSNLKNKKFIYLNNFDESLKIVCNHKKCTKSKCMHEERFKYWRDSIISYLKSYGKFKTLLNRQQNHNLWTKKNCDSTFKAYKCLYEKGLLKKDLQYSLLNDIEINLNESNAKKKSYRKNNKRLNANAIPTAFNKGNFNQMNADCQSKNLVVPAKLIARIINVSSSGDLNPSVSSSGSPGNISPTIVLQDVASPKKKKKTKKLDPFSALNGSGIFFQRKNFSAFNILPQHKLNPYHIKMEDEGNLGNDEIRSFVLSNLTVYRQCKVLCILCQASMKVYNCYPLIDGTFFLSPVKHSKGSVEVMKDSRKLYLNAICMHCLEAFSPRSRIYCIYCNTPFDGSCMVLGTMYTYDVFAAVPCCQDRVKCTCCQTPLLSSDEYLSSYSDYSRLIICPHCTTKDFHFIRPVLSLYTWKNHMS